MQDIGLLIAMLDFGTQADILQGNLLGYKGAIFENLMADFLCKSGIPLYYFHKDSGLELDFLIRRGGKCTPIEVKATTGKSKSLNTVMKNRNIYHIDNALKFGNYNVGRNGGILTLPLYMGFMIRAGDDPGVIPDVDIEKLNSLVQKEI